LQSSQADKAKLSKDVTDLSKAKANAEAATSEAKATVAELQSQLTVLLNDKQNVLICATSLNLRDFEWLYSFSATAEDRRFESGSGHSKQLSR